MVEGPRLHPGPYLHFHSGPLQLAASVPRSSPGATVQTPKSRTSPALFPALHHLREGRNPDHFPSSSQPQTLPIPPQKALLGLPSKNLCITQPAILSCVPQTTGLHRSLTVKPTQAMPLHSQASPQCQVQLFQGLKLGGSRARCNEPSLADSRPSTAGPQASTAPETTVAQMEYLPPREPKMALSGEPRSTQEIPWQSCPKVVFY